MRFRTTDRDVGLRRVSSLTRWSIGGAAALVGVLSAMVAQALPGASGTTTAPQPGAATGSPSAPSAAQPATPPTTAAPSVNDTPVQPAPPPVVTQHHSVTRSGGS